MEPAKINSWQLYSLIVLFGIGTSIVIALGSGAKQDAWIAVLLGMLGGLSIFYMHVLLYRQYPTLPLTAYIRHIAGRYIGWPIGLLYTVFLIYGSARIMRDGGDLMAISLYDQTPLLVLHVMMLAAIAYVISKGFEVLARTGEFFLIGLIVLGALGNIFILFSDIIELPRLLPVLERGWQPVVQAAFSQTISFPFGQMICMAMLYPYLNRPKTILPVGGAGIITCGLILSWTTALEISILGFDLTERSSFPLLNAISKVDIADFLTRLDAIVVLTLIICVYFKLAIFYYSAVLGAADLFKVKNYRTLILPIGVIILILSLLIAGNFTEQTYEGEIFLAYVVPVFSVVLPVLLLLIVYLRKWMGKGKSDSTG